MLIHGIEVRGALVDAETRCRHYHTAADIVAIKFACCGTYYPCYRCHAEFAGHPAVAWPRVRFDARAVLCGRCGYELTIAEYLACGAACPACGACFNAACDGHRHLYFQG